MENDCTSSRICKVCKSFAQTGQPAGGRKNLPAPAKDEKTLLIKTCRCTVCKTFAQTGQPAVQVERKIFLHLQSMKKTAVSKNLQLQSLKNKLLPRLHCVSYFAPSWGAGRALLGKIYVKVQNVWQKTHTGYKNYTGPVCKKQSVEKSEPTKICRCKVWKTANTGAKCEKLPIQVQSLSELTSFENIQMMRPADLVCSARAA